MIELKNGVTTVRGTAGGRKTQMVVELATENPSKRFLYLSYGRANADAVRGRMPVNVDVHTYHSYLYYHFKKSGRELNVVNEIKPNDLNEIYISTQGNEYKLISENKLVPFVLMVLTYFSTNAGPIGSCKAALKGYERTLNAEEIRNVMIAASTYVKHALEKGSPVTHEMYLKLGLRETLRHNPYDVIISDEHQDTSKTMQALLTHLDAMGEKCVIKLGDPLQQIFQHIGAKLDHDLLTPDIEINQTYRCGKNITKLANSITQPYRNLYSLGAICPALHEDEVIAYPPEMPTPMERGAILHYHNASVIAHAIDLVLEGKSIKIDSPSLRKGLGVYNSIISRAKRSHVSFHREIDFILRKAVGRNDRETIIAARVIAKMSNELEKLHSTLDKISRATSNPSYLLATIHYSKGQTFKQVTLGNDTAQMMLDNKYHTNVLYTGITRASEKLYVPKGLWDKLES